ncbi:lysophospholipid acyltransferase family protein [Luteimonas sp. Y-2-2-4F]|nr:lysophospholipid acyltransferase family protein [Luteimonas sp. Y-2-2-4F]MCD9032685.1 lysophospholipid acyltransferase family protein [Luteimonas sp. Y-2-2-4F]
MPQLEDRLQQRYPHWFRGRRAGIARPLLERVGRWSRLEAIEAFLGAHPGLHGFAFVAAALDHLRARYAAVDAARIPPHGRLLLVANHPSGALDALALLDCVGRVRRDVRIVANDLLAGLAPLSDLLLPVRVGARNSALFYGASALFKPAGTALLAREMFARRGRPLTLWVGEPLRLPDDEDAGAQLRRVREALYALGRRVAPAARPLAAPADPARVAAQLAGAELLGQTADGKQIRLARCAAGSPLLLELGRLRELAFRGVGEGTGRARDLDRFDPDYEHIVVWDAAAARIAGAYRVARGARLLAERGLGGLYTASLFRYADDAIPRIAQGLELGRSFVAPEYRGGRSLDYLWQGIGAYLRRYPQVRYLFGAVSISAALPRAARERLVAHYARYHGAGEAIAEAVRPFRYLAAPPDVPGPDAERAFEALRADLAALGAAVPVLYRQYTELCEPGGARFLAFGVDPGFSDSIDGLIEVDLHRLRARKRQRYLSDTGMPA